LQCTHHRNIDTKRARNRQLDTSFTPLVSNIIAMTMTASRLQVAHWYRKVFLKRQEGARLLRSHCQRASSSSSITDILASVQKGSLSINDAEQLLIQAVPNPTTTSPTSSKDTLQSFANLDHTRSLRTGFPEVVFAQNKTPQQVAMIMDDMARHVNEVIHKQQQQQSVDSKLSFEEASASTAILATR
jgi:hypothetical protein